MSSVTYPRQADFSVVREDLGRILLSDGSVVETRLILSDLVIYAEDIMGPELIFSSVVALRVKATSELIEKMRNKPFPPADRPVLVMPEAGYEKIEIERIEKPTLSSYKFDSYVLNVELEVQGVARNLSFKTQSGAPLYYVKWAIKTKSEKASE